MVNVASKSYIQDRSSVWFGDDWRRAARFGTVLILWMLASDMNEDAHGI